MEGSSELKVTQISGIVINAVTLARGGKTLFKDMSWGLQPGRFLAVTGPSGSGKSSLLACLRGTLAPTKGTVALGSEDGMSVATVFQHLRLASESSVLTNVLCGRLGLYPWWRTLFGFSEDAREEAFAICTEFGLGDIAHKAVKNISGGERQRTAIARALFQSPKILLADEPTSNLDGALARQVLTRFRRMCTDSGCTVVAVLHDRDLVEEFADHELEIGPFDTRGWRYRIVE
jgi:phosphonate transport system ATP-binding protein